MERSIPASQDEPHPRGWMHTKNFPLVTKEPWLSRQLFCTAQDKESIPQSLHQSHHWDNSIPFRQRSSLHLKASGEQVSPMSLAKLLQWLILKIKTLYLFFALNVSAFSFQPLNRVMPCSAQLEISRLPETSPLHRYFWVVMNSLLHPDLEKINWVSFLSLSAAQEVFQDLNHSCDSFRNFLPCFSVITEARRRTRILKTVTLVP